jgi:hypothetical protein
MPVSGKSENMSDLIEEYEKSGLISNPTKCFRPCDICGTKYHPDDLSTVDIERYGHDTIEVCDDCKA